MGNDNQWELTLLLYFRPKGHKMEDIALLMRNANMTSIIQDLVKGFDCDDGVSEDVFIATRKLILQEWGQSSADIFSRAIDVTDKSFFLPEDVIVESLLEEMEKVKGPGIVETPLVFSEGG